MTNKTTIGFPPLLDCTSSQRGFLYLKIFVMKRRNRVYLKSKRSNLWNDMTYWDVETMDSAENLIVTHLRGTKKVTRKEKLRRIIKNTIL